MVSIVYLKTYVRNLLRLNASTNASRMVGAVTSSCAEAYCCREHARAGFRVRRTSIPGRNNSPSGCLRVTSPRRSSFRVPTRTQLDSGRMNTAIPTNTNSTTTSTGQNRSGEPTTVVPFDFQPRVDTAPYPTSSPSSSSGAFSLEGAFAGFSTGVDKMTR